MHKLFTILLTVAALSFAIPAIAKPCALTTSQALELPGGTYLVHDACQPDCLFSVMVYEESNGIDGLQRSDSRADDTCGETKARPDTRILRAD